MPCINAKTNVKNFQFNFFNEVNKSASFLQGTQSVTSFV